MVDDHVVQLLRLPESQDGVGVAVEDGSGVGVNQAHAGQQEQEHYRDDKRDVPRYPLLMPGLGDSVTTGGAVVV